LCRDDFLDEVAKHAWVTARAFDATTNEGVIGISSIRNRLSIPGLPALELALGSMPGGVDIDIRTRLDPTPSIAVELPLTLRINAQVCGPGTNEADQGFAITELDSLNGTFVNDLPIRTPTPRSRRSRSHRRFAVFISDARR
jgi:hypothetical protein